MKFKQVLVAGAVFASAMVGVNAQAAVLSFDPLITGPTAVTSYTEAGFTITAPTGSLFAQRNIAAAPNGVPSLTFARSGTFDLTGGTFTLDGFDAFFARSPEGMIRTIDIAGFLAGVQTFTTTVGRATSFFETFNPGSGPLVFDRVTFTTGPTAANIFLDNIGVTAALPQ